MLNIANQAGAAVAKAIARLISCCCDSRGGIATSFAITLPVLLSGLGIAVDFAMKNKIQTDLQAAADSAAIAGARELSIAGVDTSRIESTVTSFVSYQMSDVDGPLNIDTTVDKSKLKVVVSLRQEWTPFFAHFLKSGVTPVAASATAVFGGTTSVCVLTLEPYDKEAISLKKNALLQGDGCTIYSNSIDEEGVSLGQSATMTAELICSAGGAVGKAAMYRPSATTDCPVFTDPLTSRPAPSISSCDFSDMTIEEGVTILTPGTYCGGIVVGGTARVEFAPGVYVIKDKKFTVKDKAAITGKNVVFYFTGKDALIDFKNDTEIVLSGREDGPLAGLLFFEDRNSDAGRVHRINSSKADTLTGTIYLPRGKLLIDPNAEVAADSAYTAIVVWQLELDFGPKLVLHSDYSETSVPVPAGISVRGHVVLVE